MRFLLQHDNIEVAYIEEKNIYILTLNSPRNVLNPSFLHIVNTSLDSVEKHARHHIKECPTSQPVLITTGRADSHIFSQGLDVKSLIANPIVCIGSFQHTAAKFLAFPMPTIAALNGHAIAGGFMLAMAHDYRVGMDVLRNGINTHYCLNEIANGFWLPEGMYQIMASKIHDKQLLRDICLRGEKINVLLALKYNIIDKIVPKGVAVLEEAIKFANSVLPVRNTTGREGLSFIEAYGAIKREMYRSELDKLIHGNVMPPKALDFSSYQQNAASL